MENPIDQTKTTVQTKERKKNKIKQKTKKRKKKQRKQRKNRGREKGDGEKGDGEKRKLGVKKGEKARICEIAHLLNKLLNFGRKLDEFF